MRPFPRDPVERALLAVLALWLVAVVALGVRIHSLRVAVDATDVAAQDLARNTEALRVSVEKLGARIHEVGEACDAGGGCVIVVETQLSGHGGGGPGQP